MFSTLMGVPRYYDEDGVYHVHDRNKHTTSYQCSNGHAWAISVINGCPAPDCSFKGESTTQFHDASLRAAAIVCG